MSDAGQPGATYGGPSPAGPGASMAERPDQAPPAPSAPPPTMAGQIPGGTPGPQPVAGGGVPPAVDAARGWHGPADSRGQSGLQSGRRRSWRARRGIPPQMLAQIGGFGGAPAGGVPYPAPPPGGLPPGAMGREPRAPGSLAIRCLREARGRTLQGSRLRPRRNSCGSTGRAQRPQVRGPIRACAPGTIKPSRRASIRIVSDAYQAG